MNRLVVAAAFVPFLTAGCTSSNLPGPNTDAHIQASVADAQRSLADRARDRTRRPASVLAFFGIEPGDTVLDLYAGGGYYTEIVARAVGPSGSVHSHNNRAYLAFADKELSTRFTDNRLPNVTRITAENNALNFASETYDAALMILAYHDVYFVDEKNGWPRIDGPAMLAHILASLKPGGVLGVVDHAAAPGAPAAVGGTLHRIDPARVRREISAAGFVLEAQSDVLANPTDTHSLAMFDEAIKGKTNRFVYRFRKP